MIDGRRNPVSKVITYIKLNNEATPVEQYPIDCVYLVVISLIEPMKT